jgi:hypothetical protein
MSDATSTNLAPLAPAVLARFDATLDALRLLNRTAFLHYALAVGDHLLVDWYQGDIRVYRDRRSGQHGVFDALVRERREALEDLGLSATTLRHYLLAACTWRELPDAVRERLDLTHLQRLAAVRDPIFRVRLAHDAAMAGLSSRELEKAISDHNQEARTGQQKRGRKPQPKPVKAWGAAFQAVRQARKQHQDLAGLTDDQRQKVRKEIGEMVTELQAMLAAIGA